MSEGKALKPLSAEEIATMRAHLEATIQVSEYEWRVLATLERGERAIEALRNAGLIPPPSAPAAPGSP